LRGARAALRHEPGDGALGHVEAELQELACVQSNADVFSGDSPAGARASSPIAWMAGRRVTDVLEPIDNPLARRVSECPGRNGSERTGSPKLTSPGGRAFANYAKAAGAVARWLARLLPALRRRPLEPDGRGGALRAHLRSPAVDAHRCRAGAAVPWVALPAVTARGRGLLAAHRDAVTTTRRKESFSKHSLKNMRDQALALLPSPATSPSPPPAVTIWAVRRPAGSSKDPSRRPTA
jgi:hypothetical protein